MGLSLHSPFRHGICRGWDACGWLPKQFYPLLGSEVVSRWYLLALLTDAVPSASSAGLALIRHLVVLPVATCRLCSCRVVVNNTLGTKCPERACVHVECLSFHLNNRLVPGLSHWYLRRPKYFNGPSGPSLFTRWGADSLSRSGFLSVRVSFSPLFTDPPKSLDRSTSFRH